MEYVAQKHPLGCMIAAAAMVLDLTYEQVSDKVPLQSIEDLRQTGINGLGIVAWNNLKTLARARGKVIFDFPDKPFILRPGLRYLGMLPTANYLLTHVVAIDETGVVFDPDPAKEQSRENWETYDFMAMLEFRSQ